jgi:hypothetical protein
MKRSRYERERRSHESEEVARIEAAWRKSLPEAVARAFERDVAVARARPPEGRPPDMAPGTKPNPPRPGREPREPDARPPRRGGR